MSRKKLSLRVLLEQDENSNEENFLKPTYDQALYVEPMQGRFENQGRKCSNCAFWITSNHCNIHPLDLDINGNFVCGYHVPGSPSNQQINYRNIEPLNPELSGLEEVSNEGTHCGNCQFFKGDEDGGTCGRLKNEQGGNAEVQFYGCCTVWTGQNNA